MAVWNIQIREESSGGVRRGQILIELADQIECGVWVEEVGQVDSKGSGLSNLKAQVVLTWDEED